MSLKRSKIKSVIKEQSHVNEEYVKIEEANNHSEMHDTKESEDVWTYGKDRD